MSNQSFLETFIHIQLSISFIILKEFSPGTFWHFQTELGLCSWRPGISLPHQPKDPFTSLLTWMSCVLDPSLPVSWFTPLFYWNASFRSFLRKRRQEVSFSRPCMSRISSYFWLDIEWNWHEIFFRIVKVLLLCLLASWVSVETLKAMLIPCLLLCTFVDSSLCSQHPEISHWPSLMETGSVHCADYFWSWDACPSFWGHFPQLF